jgi:hypothetical protein
MIIVNYRKLFLLLHTLEPSSSLRKVMKTTIAHEYVRRACSFNYFEQLMSDLLGLRFIIISGRAGRGVRTRREIGGASMRRKTLIARENAN